MPPSTPLRARPWAIRLATTLVAWSIAFLIVLALLVLFGGTLESLPYALNALVFTGVLVPIMGNLVMPAIGVAIARRLTSDPRSQPAPCNRAEATPAINALLPDRGAHDARIPTDSRTVESGLRSRRP